jgi:hypothetical protein
VVTFAERAGSWLGAGLSPGLSPFWAFSVEGPLLSTIVESSGCRPQLGEVLSESSNEVMMSLIFFSPVSKVTVIIYRYGLAVLVGPTIFLLQPQTFGVFYRYLGLTVLEIYLWGELLPPVTLAPLWYAF